MAIAIEKALKILLGLAAFVVLAILIKLIIDHFTGISVDPGMVVGTSEAASSSILG